jgi:demethylmenaquinone methyltransferase/2-methoxy-6-polyprenyl-1,4-benzoquinol methylase
MSVSYERVNYITSFGFSLRWRKQFLKTIAPSNEALRIMDLMTGMGETWNPIRHRFPNAELSTLDYSEGMLVHANHKNKKSF